MEKETERNRKIRQEGVADKYYYMLTDHQGSIIRAYAEDGTDVFSTSYDAWGKQTVEKNSIGLRRGYTSHEMLADFKLINMNGRLYDPLIGRFLSPDNYVQLPDNSQNFNRYSYCLNNPLKYVDPSGESFGLLVSIFTGAIMGGINAVIHHDKILAGTLIGGLVGGLSWWASGFMSTLTSANNIWAGSLIGAGTGATVGAASSFLTNGLNNLLNGRDFSEGLWSNLGSNALNGVIAGAISGGISAYHSCRERGINPFTGEEERSTYSNIVDGRKQPDPTKHCYAYAGEYASKQIGKPHTAESILQASKNADGNSVIGAWKEMNSDINVSHLKYFPQDIELKQFTDAFNRRKFTAEITISNSPTTHHVVTLNKFDVVTRHNWFGLSAHAVMSHIYVFDSLTGVTEHFYGKPVYFDIIK